MPFHAVHAGGHLGVLALLQGIHEGAGEDVEAVQPPRLQLVEVLLHQVRRAAVPRKPAAHTSAIDCWLQPSALAEAREPLLAAYGAIMSCTNYDTLIRHQHEAMTQL
jgi:hypothetical protein